MLAVLVVEEIMIALLKKISRNLFMENVIAKIILFDPMKIKNALISQLIVLNPGEIFAGSAIKIIICLLIFSFKF